MQQSARPTALLLHAGMLLGGLGMTILGPILPLVIAHWGLRDSKAGLLLTAQFLGMSSGGVAISRRLSNGLLTGIFISAAGYGGLALLARGGSAAVGGLASGCILLWVAGFGLGQLVTAINLVAGERYGAKRGSALSLLNFSWSVGAILSPLLAGWLTSRMSLAALLSAFAWIFLVLGFGVVREFLSSPFRLGAESGCAGTDMAPGSISAGKGKGAGIGASTFLYFAALFFLYGGLESGMNGWLTTYTLRYGRQGFSVSVSSAFLFWIALTSGRALASGLLLRMSEGVLLMGSLGLGVAAVGVLMVAPNLAVISIGSVLTGLALAPFFPSTVSVLLQRGPRPRQAAFVLAATALGGATQNWLIGQVSARLGSLQRALVLPLIGCVLLLVLTAAGNVGRVRRAET